MRNLKILSVIAAALAFVLLLGACNQNGGVTTDPSGNTDGTTQAPTGTTGEPGNTTVPSDGTTEPSGTTGATEPSQTQPPENTDPPATTVPQGGNPAETDVKYTVTVLDGDGKPVKNVIVELSNG